MPKTDAVTYLRTLALSRIVLHQRAQPAVVLGHDGPQGGAGGAALRRQRLRQPDDGGERGVGGRAPPSAPRWARSSATSRDAGLHPAPPAPGLFADRVAADRRGMTRTGIGYDSHRFAPGRRLVLGGITIPHPEGLAGHSDADVVAHALTDAILGAAGAGSIGAPLSRHRPPLEGRRLDRPAARGLRDRAGARVHASCSATSP